MIGKLKLECSPRTFKRIQNDAEYKQLIYEQCRESLGENFNPQDEIVFSSSARVGDGYEAKDYEEIDNFTPPQIESFNQLSEPVQEEEKIEFSDCQENLGLGEDQKKNMWLEAPTKLLLFLLEKYQNKIGKTFELSSKKKMWKLISKQLKEKGYAFSEMQVQSKYRGLERNYKRTKIHNSKTGRNRMTCEYQSEMDKVFGIKRGVFPEFLLDEEQAVGVSREEQIEAVVGVSREEPIEAAGLNEDDGPNDVNVEETLPHISSLDESLNSKPKQKTFSVQKKMAETLIEMKAERATYHNKIVQLMEQKSNRAEKKLEISEKKLELFQKFVNEHI